METLFERLADYVSRSDPQWRRTIRGASSEDLARLTQMSGLQDLGRQYPPSYLIYAQHLGQDDGGLIAPPLSHRSIDWLLGLYEEAEQFEYDEMSPEAPLVGSFETGDQLSLDFRDGSSGEPAVYVTSYGEFISFYAESWEKLLFQHASLRAQRRQFPVTLSFSASQAGLRSALGSRGGSAAEVLSQLAEQEGLMPAWFNDRAHFCAAASDVQVWTKLPEEGGIVIVASGAARERVDGMAQRLAAQLGAEPTR
ncbi:SMI1/KNR4 family protein [Eleftheria terrae]|uniref:SMI1/KNR4 family protein n=1 Tax=Eleftheria terrae TaxID=1597781 RepID=UPI00263B5B2F|nr:SMI1/KNR4 family protein [Eleftheria terrae]WKB53296.1 hypothetical protein N7L95_02550 [Eleftheria terrae]